jgi:hypothetical protein
VTKPSKNGVTAEVAAAHSGVTKEPENPMRGVRAALCETATTPRVIWIRNRTPDRELLLFELGDHKPADGYLHTFGHVIRIQKVPPRSSQSSGVAVRVAGLLGFFECYRIFAKYLQL